MSWDLNMDVVGCATVAVAVAVAVEDVDEDVIGAALEDLEVAQRTKETYVVWRERSWRMAHSNASFTPVEMGAVR